MYRIVFKYTFFLLPLLLLSCGGSQENDGVKIGPGGGGNNGGGGDANESCSSTKQAAIIGLDPILGPERNAELCSGDAFFDGISGVLCSVNLEGLGASSNGLCSLSSNTITVVESDISCLNPIISFGSCENGGANDGAITVTSVDTSQNLLNVGGPNLVGQMQLQQLTAYYHSYGTLQIARAAGSNTLPSVSIFAHCGVYGNAFYTTSPGSEFGALCLGYSFDSSFNPIEEDPITKFRSISWASQDATVISHEFGHAINIANTSFGDTIEASALNEGLADYWAWRQTNHDRIGEYFFGGYFPSGARNIINPTKKYPDDLSGSYHDNGTIFAQALYKIINPDTGSAVAADKLDELVINMLKRSTSNTLTLTGAATKLHELARADRSEGGVGLTNAQVTKINSTLTDKGLKSRTISLGSTDLSIFADTDTEKAVYIIDDQSFPGASDKNNCDGILQVGEEVLLVVNLRLSQSASIDDPGLGLLEANLEIANDTNGIYIPTSTLR